MDAWNLHEKSKIDYVISVYVYRRECFLEMDIGQICPRQILENN